MDAKYRPQIFFPSLKFLNIKSIVKNKDMDARNSGYYWFVKEDFGIRAEYIMRCRVVLYCNITVYIQVVVLQCIRVEYRIASSTRVYFGLV